jgi:hypothetical protein
MIRFPTLGAWTITVATKKLEKKNQVGNFRGHQQEQEM